MAFNPNEFAAQSKQALENNDLQQALMRAKSGFTDKRKNAISLVDNFEYLKAQAQKAKSKALNHLPFYLKEFERNLTQNGGHLHWAETPEQLNKIVYRICQQHQTKLVTKGKSMISEETHLNEFLESKGIKIAETDLGEYIIQLAKEKPSHIIAPAVHKTKDQVAELFKSHHALGDRSLDENRALVDEARHMLRKAFLNADVGITGANLLVANTGAAAIVTNEGNGDLTATLPKVHIVTSSIEKVVADMDDAASILQVLGRSATGQAMSTYTTFFNGPKKPNDLDGPDAFHVVLLDNKQSEILNSKYQDMLRCIKCGACLNHCPVYGAVGGHAYGDVYPGPMGSVLTPLMKGLEHAKPLPHASTFCGRCEEVCPMGIPLPELLRQLRNDQASNNITSLSERALLKLHGWILNHPKFYHFAFRALRNLLWAVPSSVKNKLPKPPQKSFLDQWNKR